MKNKTRITIAAIAILLVTTAAFTTTNNAFATRQKTESTDQQNSCGNDDLALNIFCQSAASQVQGRDNAVFVNATQP